MARCTRYASECKRGCTTTCACENSYLPSNGTEGMIFEDNFCSHCIHDNPVKEKYCPIITAAMCFSPTEPEYPKEWIIKDGHPTCTNYLKWDWGNDGDPTDRFPLKASTIAHGMKDGLIEATKRITGGHELSFREITSQKEVGIAKIIITEL